MTSDSVNQTGLDGLAALLHQCLGSSLEPELGVLKATEVAELLDCGFDTVCDYANRGHLPALKIGRSWIFPTEALERQLNKMADEGAAERRRSQQPIVSDGLRALPPEKADESSERRRTPQPVASRGRRRAPPSLS